MPDVITISNTSPLLYLHLVGQLDLFPILYGQVIVPPAVEAELEVGGQKGISVPVLAKFPWVQIRQVTAHELIPLVTDLGRGEAEVIGLGLEHPGSRLILDDTLGRRIAKLWHLQITGTLGVVVKAKQQGVLTAVKPVIYALRHAGLWLSDELIHYALAEAGEL